MLTGTHKTQRTALVLALLGKYHKDSNEFLSHNETGDETWVTFANVKSKQQSKAVGEHIHIHRTGQNVSTSVVCQPETDRNCSQGQERV
jgi:hypothetical protein